ncbi:fasciclin domain-containing protein [Oculatella sp. LEGE 06141]|nr:fasciclin domain-containing protein [Oculatella sp. LEGE 06141]
MVALPAIAQMNPAPSIFSEPPYNGSATAQGTPEAPDMTLEAMPGSMDKPEAMDAPGGMYEPEAPATSVAPTASEGTIVDIASTAGNFETLTAALTAAGLTDVLAGEGPYTVFAPTDAAFAALPEGTVEELLKPENREALIQVLTYHVVPGTVTSDQLSSGDVDTVEGSPVTVTVDDDMVMVNEATVTQADIEASNGVIHVIDQVILPPGM